MHRINMNLPDDEEEAMKELDGITVEIAEYIGEKIDKLKPNKGDIH